MRKYTGLAMQVYVKWSTTSLGSQTKYYNLKENKVNQSILAQNNKSRKKFQVYQVMNGVRCRLG